MRSGTETWPRRSLGRGGVALLLCALPALAAAHNRSVSYSDWTVQDTVLQAELRLPLRELNPLGLDPHDPATADAIASAARDGLAPGAAGRPCALTSQSARIGGDAVHVSLAWQCDTRADTLDSQFLLDRIPGHLHLMQLHAGAHVLGPYALSAAQPRAQWSADPDVGPPSVSGYVVLGGQHILSGWDHLAYLVVVLLGAATLRQLAWRITGFTLGHSLTLGLATLGWVQPSSAMVEAFIALTIVCTAVERLVSGHPRAALHAGAIALLLAAAGWLAGTLPFALVPATVLLTAGVAAAPKSRPESLQTTLFGLFHGFGFAGVLAQLSRGEPVPALPLFGFNLGVEIGQLLFVLPLWWLLAQVPRLRGPALALPILLLGVYWYIQRIVG
ncbi:HupE/UreJ family protein [Sinimarinibacterium sp. CAU 1509]|uniref:HupE/UreJ family protein n=1 Tax=Sinimarinibacterium sp. CAU 1509 TaxID=2562283 RepID=UPI0010AD822A|nr:HupE/UreJ family protein [Sinimarinibacterium sp. CAU 1509]TJY62257.1 HupE/UreJ family protein [Sinimarinibacterium sp. CAU 1509]